ncbi:hypothetical protein D1AOALGA4SA_10910 [Olavius algarvensis Delta 1 endosymbiont]|nr:hypothetical protein D1AOALGA4SA_10910 [Olavius algarvensis Delta 1 endosymbiont]
MSGFGCQETDELIPCMKLFISLKANRRISNKRFRMMKCGIAALSLFRACA